MQELPIPQDSEADIPTTQQIIEESSTQTLPIEENSVNDVVQEEEPTTTVDQVCHFL
jgi:hypothetical protein